MTISGHRSLNHHRHPPPHAAHLIPCYLIMYGGGGVGHSGAIIRSQKKLILFDFLGLMVYVVFALELLQKRNAIVLDCNSIFSGSKLILSGSNTIY